jgi:hypothetical protein
MSLGSPCSVVRLGEGAGAVALLERGLAGLPQSYRRDRAWFQACLARAHAVAGDAEGAIRTAVGTAVDAVAVGGSARGHAVQELRAVAHTLDRMRAPGRVVIEDALAAAASTSGEPTP